jgi:carboxylesterase
MRRVVGIALLVLVLAALWLGRPFPRLESDPRPATSYAEAVRLVEALRAQDSPAIANDCRTRLLTHGVPTRLVVVMLHGLTNCPAQFDSLGSISFARGANVLIPRLPRHGFADRMTDELGRARTRELRAFADRVLDAAQGLGDSVTVVGLSVGGTLAVWAAQERRDVDHAVVIAPMLGLSRMGGRWTPLIARFAGALPNFFVWWDGRRKQALPGPEHVYPRFASRSVAATLRLGWMAREGASRKAPACRSLVMVTVGGDRAVDNGLCAEVVRAWRRHGAQVTTHEFPAELRLNHDVVDPDQVGANPAVTYPVLARLIGP